jgi:hypothetical protein
MVATQQMMLAEFTPVVPNMFFEEMMMMLASLPRQNNSVATIMKTLLSSSLPASEVHNIMTYDWICWCGFAVRYVRINTTVQSKLLKVGSEKENDVYLRVTSIQEFFFFDVLME